MQENIIQCSIKCDTKKSVGYGLSFCDLCTEFPKNEISSIIFYRFNEGNRNIRIIDINKTRIYNNHNKENNMEEASDIPRSNLGRYGRTTTGDTGSLFLAGILNKIEDTRIVIAIAHTNYETLQVSDVIESDSDIDEGPNYDIEDSAFKVDDEDINNFHEE